ALHQPGAPVARRDRCGAAHARRPVPRRARHRYPRPRRRHQGRPADGAGDAAGGQGPAAGTARRHRRRRGRRRHPAAPRGDPSGPRPRPRHPQAAQRRPQAVRHRPAERACPRRSAHPRPPLRRRDLPYARMRLWAEPGVVSAFDGLWPLLTPERLLADLLGSPQAIRSAAGSLLDHSERNRLTRSGHPSRWTVADVPLLDEAAELLGVDDSAQKAARRELERAQRLEAKYAAEVLDITGIADLGMVDAETLAAWNRDNGPALSTAERAEADRSWAYGHVI